METKLKYAVEGTLLRIELNGDYLEYDDDEVVRRLYEAAESAEVRSLEVRAEKLERWDSTLLVILFNLEKTARRRKIEIKMLSLPAGLKKCWLWHFPSTASPAAKTGPSRACWNVSATGALILPPASKGDFLSARRRAFFRTLFVRNRGDAPGRLSVCAGRLRLQGAADRVIDQFHGRPDSGLCRCRSAQTSRRIMLPAW